MGYGAPLSGPGPPPAVNPLPPPEPLQPSENNTLPEATRQASPSRRSRSRRRNDSRRRSPGRTETYYVAPTQSKAAPAAKKISSRVSSAPSSGGGFSAPNAGDPRGSGDSLKTVYRAAASSDGGFQKASAASERERLLFQLEYVSEEELRGMKFGHVIRYTDAQAHATELV